MADDTLTLLPTQGQPLPMNIRSVLQESPCKETHANVTKVQWQCMATLASQGKMGMPRSCAANTQNLFQSQPPTHPSAALPRAAETQLLMGVQPSRHTKDIGPRRDPLVIPQTWAQGSKPTCTSPAAAGTMSPPSPPQQTMCGSCVVCWVEVGQYANTLLLHARL